MRRIVPFGLFLAACSGPLAGRAPAAADPPARPRDEALRRELLTRLDAEQAIRLALARKQQQGLAPDSLDLERVLAIDTANTAWLNRVVVERGWPGRSLVGADGANAAFLLVQHADRDTAFQARVLPLLERACAAGEAEGSQVALLTDRLAVARGKPQVYGLRRISSAGGSC
jgi:hypothetical protein